MRWLLGLILLGGCHFGFGPWQGLGTYPYVYVRNAYADTVWVGITGSDSTMRLRVIAMVPPGDSTCVRLPYQGRVNVIVATWTARRDLVLQADKPKVWIIHAGPRSPVPEETVVRVCGLAW